MQAVLIAMTILGCDDSVSQCNYVATVDKRWETVAAWIKSDRRSVIDIRLAR